MKKVEKRQKISVMHKLAQAVFIISLMFVVFPSRINAESENLYIECDENTLKNEQIATCYVKFKNYTGYVSSFQGILTLSNNISFTAITKDSIWEGATNGGDIDLYTDINKTGNFNILSFSFRVPSSVNQIEVTLDEVAVSDENFVGIDIPKIVKTVNISNVPAGENPGNEDPIDNPIDNPIDDPIDNPTTAKTTTKKVTTEKPVSNVDNNPKTGFNPIYLLIVLVVTISGMVLFVRKGASDQSE